MQWQESINAVHGTQERQQRWLDPQHHLLGNGLDERYIADELDRIPQAVVAAHQHLLACQRCAIPDVLQMPRPMPTRRSSSRLQHRIANRPRRLKGAASHVRHPTGGTLLTELIVHTCIALPL